MEIKPENNRPVKKNGYKYHAPLVKKDKRRQEANARNLIYKSLNKENKIKLIKSRRGNSKRELNRLAAK